MLDTTTIAAAAEAVVADVFREAFRTIAYHETELPKAHRRLANTHAILQRASLLVELSQARKTVDALDDEDDASNVQQFAAILLVEAADGIDYHEKNLAIGHTKLANAKAMMQRCGLDLPLADIEAKACERADA